MVVSPLFMLGHYGVDAFPYQVVHGPPHRERHQAQAFVQIAFYILFDYTVGWWIMVRPLLVRSTLVVFDRYYHDLLVNPLRYRYGGPMWLARWIGKLIP